MTIPDDMNELTDVNIDRVDLVGKAANGTRFIMAKAAADGPNLLDAETVRDLIKEADADDTPADLTSTLEAITKAGRALSSANETALRNAAESIQKVLASLPAPEEAPIEKETPVAEETTEETTVEKADAAEPAAAVEAAPEAVEKAEPLVAVYDAAGKLMGVIKPNSLTPVAAEGSPEEEAAETPDEEAAEDAADTFEESADDEVQPDDGAPAESAADDEAVIPGTETVQSPIEKGAEPATVTQAPDVAALLKEALAPLVEKIADAADLANEVKVLKERVEAYGREPDDRKSPVLNGATGTAGIAKRAADTDELANLAKSVEIAKEAGNPTLIANAAQAYAYAAIRERFNN